MKKMKFLSLSLAVFALLSVSCSSEETAKDTAAVGNVTTSDVMPTSTGKVVTLSADITFNTDDNLKSIQWSDGGSTPYLATSLDGNTSSVNVSWSSAGEHVVQCAYSYYSVNSSSNVTKTAQKNVTVKQSHMINSLIGESLESVLKYNSSLAKLEGEEGVYFMNDDTRSYFYTFASSKLENVSVYHKVSTTNEKAAANALFTEYVKFDDGLDEATLAYEVLENGSMNATVQAAIDDFKTNGSSIGDDTKTTLTSALNSGEIIGLGIVANINDNSGVKRSFYVQAATDANQYSITVVVK